MLLLVLAALRVATGPAAIALWAYLIFSLSDYQLDLPAILFPLVIVAGLAVATGLPARQLARQPTHEPAREKVEPTPLPRWLALGALFLFTLTGAVLLGRSSVAHYLYQRGDAAQAAQWDANCGFYAFRAGGLAEQQTGADNPVRPAWPARRARRFYLEAAAQMPNIIPVAAQAGSSLAQAGRYSDALPWLERTVALDYYFTLAHFHLGRARLRTGDRAGAIEAFSSALLIQPATLLAEDWLYPPERDVYSESLERALDTVAGNGMVNNAGNGTLAILASVKAPVDVAVDGAGNLYISQHVSHIIRYVNPNGFIFTVAGIADDPGFSEDLGNPFTAKLNGPAGLVAEGEGAFLLADHRNHRIRFFQPKPQLSVLPASFDLEAIAGAVDPLLEMVTIANTVSGTASWTARATTARATTPGGLGWLSIFPKTGLTPATVTVSVDASGLAVGDHRGTVFIAPVLDPADTALIPVRVAVAESAPVIGEGGIVNGASFSGEATVSPGSIASLFGMNLAAGTETASGLPLPTMLAGTQVLVDDVPAPLFFVSPLQINFQVPFEATGSSVPMVVVSNGVPGPEVMVQVEAAAPGIFTAVPGGSGPGAILNEDFSPNSAENPAAVGSVVQIFATGLGATDPPLATGQTGASAPPLNLTAMVPVVMIGGAPAEVLFSGMAPGFVGLYQVNARVPAATPAGDEVPLEIEIGEGSSNTVTLAVD